MFSISCVLVWSQEAWEEAGTMGEVMHLGNPSVRFCSLISSTSWRWWLFFPAPIGKANVLEYEPVLSEATSPLLVLSSSWAVRRRVWDFTCLCVLGDLRYDKGNHSVPAASLACTITLISPVWAPLKKQDLNCHTFYLPSLEFSFNESVT